MAQWKKVIVSGSSAELANLKVSSLSSGVVTGATGNLTTTPINGTGNIVATNNASGLKHSGSFSGSFTGTFVGDGSQLTGLSSGAVAVYTNPGNNRIITSVDADEINGEANLTFDGSVLTVTGRASISTSVTASRARLTGLSAGVDNTVLVLDSQNNVVTDEINSKVWDAVTLVDVTGTPSNNQIATFTDADTVNGEANLTFDGTLLTVTGRASISTSVTASSARFTGLAGVTDDTVLVLSSTNNVGTRDVDTRIWGTSLVDAANGVDNRLATFSDANSLNGEANLTFDGTLLTVTGRADVSGPITGSNLRLDGTLVDGAGEATVLVLHTNGDVRADEIDTRVWGTTLIDASGTPSANQVPYFTDANTVAAEAAFTYNPSTDILTVGTSTFGTNVVVAGDLTVQGNTFNVNVTNLNVEDKFILLNSGSASGDGGIIVQNDATAKGFAFAFDDSADRWGFQGNVELHATGSVLIPEAYASAVIDVDGGLTDISLYQKNGNIKVSGGDIFIYA